MQKVADNWCFLTKPYIPSSFVFTHKLDANYQFITQLNISDIILHQQTTNQLVFGVYKSAEKNEIIQQALTSMWYD